MTESELKQYASQQLMYFFPDKTDLIGLTLKVLKESLDRSLYCFSKVNCSIYRDGSGAPRFNHLNWDQYATFLYFFGKVAFEKDIEEI